MDHGAVIHVRNHAYPTKKVSIIVVVQISVNWNTCESLVYVGLRVCMLRNKFLSRVRTKPTLFPSVHSFKHGRRRHVQGWFS